MKKYSVDVVMSYWQTIEVEAASQEEAEVAAYDAFDLEKATQGEGEVMYVRGEDDFNDEALLAEYEDGVHAAELENFDPITHIEAQERTGELK